MYAGTTESAIKSDRADSVIIGEVRIGNDAFKFLYNVDFSTYFDNREYRSPYQIPQTIFSFRLSPEIGIGLTDKFGGKHKLIAGVHYTQPIGGDWNNVRFAPTAYYRFKIKGFSVALGAVPFKERLEIMPDYLMYDSIAYTHPNIQGALLSYVSRHGLVEFMCDWRGSQTPARREMFRLLLNGRYHYKWFNIGGYGQINHKAGFASPAPYEGVCDDIYINPQVGFDVSAYLPMDSLAVRVGYILGIQNHRSVESYKKPQGLMLELYANWRFIGLKNTFYYGENLMPFYSEFGADLNQGDPFYQSNLYNRTDLFLYLYRNNFVNCYFSWNFHYDNVRLQHQQQLIVRFSLDGFRQDSKLKGLFDK
jgi:hypothetical protein